MVPQPGSRTIVEPHGSDAPHRPLPVGLIDRVTLRDGRTVVLRPVLPQDAAAAQAFVRALSQRSRQRRFHAGIAQLPPSLLERMIGVDHETHVAVVAQPADADSDEPGIVADARYVLDEDGCAAEFALAVADAWQGQGLGRTLLRVLTHHAARRGVRELHGDVLAENRPMVGLVESLGAAVRVVRGERGVLRARFVLAPPAGGPCPREQRRQAEAAH